MSTKQSYQARKQLSRHFTARKDERMKHLPALASVLTAVSLATPALAFGGKPETKINGLTQAEAKTGTTRGFQFLLAGPPATDADYSDPNAAPFDDFEFGTGLAGLSYHLGSSQFAIADLITPFTLTRNNVWGMYSSWKDSKGWHHSSIWSVQAGLSVTKQENKNVDLGLTLVPYLYRNDLFGIGIGAAVQTVNGSFSGFGLNNLSIIAPMTYQF